MLCLNTYTWVLNPLFERENEIATFLRVPINFFHKPLI